MPKIQEFPISMMNHVKNVIGVSGNALRESATFGSEYMKHYIESNSPTGSQWHATKNQLNSYRTGSRIGGTIDAQAGPYVFQADPHPGKMLESVGPGKLQITAQKIGMTYGWVKARDQYFLLQDTGGYIKTAKGKGKTGVGMGLLNTASDGGGKSTLQQLGAFHATNKHFVDQMKNAGFKVSGSSINV